MKKLLTGSIFLANTAIIALIATTDISTKDIVGTITPSNENSEANSALASTAKPERPVTRAEIAPSIKSPGTVKLEQNAVVVTAPSIPTVPPALALKPEAPAPVAMPTPKEQTIKMPQLAKLDAVTPQVPSMGEEPRPVSSPSPSEMIEAAISTYEPPAPSDPKGADANAALAEIMEKLQDSVQETEIVSAPSETEDSTAALVSLKPKMARFVTGYAGEYEDGLINTSDDYSVLTAAPQEAISLSVASYPLDGNEYRLTDYPGYCGQVAYGELANGDQVVWLPMSGPSGIAEIDKYQDLIIDFTNVRPETMKSRDLSIGFWVICADEKLNGQRPFSSPTVLNHLSGKKLGKPTFIF